jgi:predicted DNA-binding transcriptional regulator AlpA
MNLIRMPDLLQQMKCSRAHVYNLIADRHFPPQMHLGGRGAWWDATEVEAWLVSSKAEERKAA